MIEVIFLLCIAVAWILFATVSDVKSTEIPDWLSLSLVVFVLGFRFFYSLFSGGNFEFFYQGVIGLAIFIALGFLLYYSRIFAGGDAKLMMALGVVLPFSDNFFTNLRIFSSFLVLFLVIGAVYGIIMSVIFSARNFGNFKKELKKRRSEFMKISLPVNVLGIATMTAGLFYNDVLFYIGALIFIMPLLYVYSKSVDESCMIKKVLPENLREGDWLYKDVKIGGRTIKANWEGLGKQEINFLRKKQVKVVIRYGIVFAPVFLASFLILIYFYFFNNSLFSALWNSFW